MDNVSPECMISAEETKSTEIFSSIPCNLINYEQFPVQTHWGVWWLSGKFGELHPVGRRFESHTSSHIGTLGKPFTHSCLCIAYIAFDICAAQIYKRS